VIGKISPRERARLFSALLRGGGVALVFAVIWGPWFAYNQVSEARLGPDTIEKARRIPDDALLAELGSYNLHQALHWADHRQLVTAAEKLLLGRVELPGFPAGTVTLPLNAAAMASGPTMWQLFVHSLGLPRVLLDAYKADGRAEFLDAAAKYLVAYDAYEGSGWGPGGYLWNDTWRRFVRNDHAVAARVPVLTEFWRLYRRSPNYRSDVAESVFRMAARGAHLLADPSRFTAATNHGVMQNLATCNIALSFPTLPGVEGHCRLAFNRLDEQLAFFINDEGFVLEHSPGYQGFAVVLIGIALRYVTLSEQEIPQHWRQKYQAAQRVYAELRRPDGSLPVFGDTDGGLNGVGPVAFAELRRANGSLPIFGDIDGRSGSAGPIIFAFDDQERTGLPAERLWSPKDAVLLAPVAGYCLWWDGLDDWPNARRLSQTAIAWSYFQGMGHKHADEMSLAVWAGGTSWWANLGYWSYDAAGREMAESWEGANAPHLVDERTDSPRQTRLRYHGRDGRLAVIDLERRGPGPYRARRQVVHVGSRLWIVIDTSSGVKGARTRTTWTTSPSVELESGGGGAYTLADSRTRQSLRAFFDGAPGAARSTIEGSRSPFGGWSVVQGMAQPAPAVVVEQPADGSWTLAAWSLADGSRSGPGLAGAPRMQRWTGAEDWEVILPTGVGQLKLQRRQGRIDMSASSGRIWSLELEPGPDVSQATTDLSTALASASEKYRTPDTSVTYRIKVTVVLLVALVLNAIILRVVGRYRPAWTLALGFILAAGWLLVSYYFVFLRAQLV